MRLVANQHLVVMKDFKTQVEKLKGEDGSLAILTVMNNELDGDLNYYDPDILLHIENCGRGNYEGNIR